jgi:hypothetical protein
MSLANRPLPWWLGPVLLAIVAVDVAVSIFTRRALPTVLMMLPILLATFVALDFVGAAGKRRLRVQVRPASVFTVEFDLATAGRLSGLGEGSLSLERVLLVVDPATLEFWTEEARPKRVLVIAWQRLAGATVEHLALPRHTIALQLPGADQLVLDVVRPRHERLRQRADTAAQLAAELEAQLPQREPTGVATPELPDAASTRTPARTD